MFTAPLHSQIGSASFQSFRAPRSKADGKAQTHHNRRQTQLNYPHGISFNISGQNIIIRLAHENDQSDQYLQARAMD